MQAAATQAAATQAVAIAKNRVRTKEWVLPGEPHPSFPATQHRNPTLGSGLKIEEGDRCG
jgi:hypothetical protein